MAEPTPDPHHHPSFRPPADLYAAIWRYMDFPKFAWMIFEQRLFMPRCSVLARVDPFEASTPIARYRRMQKIADEAPSPEHRQIVVDNMKKLSGFSEQWMQGYFVSCWHLSDYESDAMWKLYGGSNNCIAIRSTYTKLRACLPPRVYLGQVGYIDYETEDFPALNMFEAVVHKRRAFEHEREVRAVAWHLFDTDDHVAANSNPYGYFPVVDVELLIECIYVHPLAEDWFLHSARKVVRMAGHALPVHRSEMAAVPVF
jgi:hypothetical protein